MVLADSSIWADHIRNPHDQLEHLLATDRIAMHPYVLGELAMGNLAQRSSFLKKLADLPAVRKAQDAEVMRLTEAGKHFGTGVGWVDMHLLAAVLLDDRFTLWTRDRRLNAAAARYGRAMILHH